MEARSFSLKPYLMRKPTAHMYTVPCRLGIWVLHLSPVQHSISHSSCVHFWTFLRNPPIAAHAAFLSEIKIKIKTLSQRTYVSKGRMLWLGFSSGFCNCPSTPNVYALLSVAVTRYTSLSEYQNNGVVLFLQKGKETVTIISVFSIFCPQLKRYPAKVRQFFQVAIYYHSCHSKPKRLIIL